jgi:hypothetical protein
MPQMDVPEKKWITINGSAHEVDSEEADKLKQEGGTKDLRGEKEKNTKEARKAFVHRLALNKSNVNYREEVFYDEFQKSGTIYGFNGEFVRILSKGRQVQRHINNVFKSSEMIGNYHWDTLHDSDRLELLKSTVVSPNYLKSDWVKIPAIIRDKIMKGAHPAGYEGNSGGVETTTPGVYNPVNDHKTISQRIKETDDKDENEARKDS